MNSDERNIQYAGIRQTALVSTLKQQRETALSDLATSTAERAVLEQALKDTLEINKGLNSRIVHNLAYIAELERTIELMKKGVLPKKEELHGEEP